MPLWKLHLGLEFNGKLSSSLDVLDWVLVLLMSSQRGESNKLFDFLGKQGSRIVSTFWDGRSSFWS